MLLASLKNFSLAILHNLSFYTDISKNNLFFKMCIRDRDPVVREIVRVEIALLAFLPGAVGVLSLIHI